WQALDSLSRQQQLIFVTHRYECDNYSIHQVTCAWLKKHGVSNPVVYFTQSLKSELIGKLKVELFVDDRHENCRDVAENNDAVVLMPHRPYNQTFSTPGSAEFRTWTSCCRLSLEFSALEEKSSCLN